MSSSSPLYATNILSGREGGRYYSISIHSVPPRQVNTCMRRCSLHIRLWARVFTKTSPRWGFYQKPIWGFCRNLFYETPQIFSWGFYRNFNEVSRKNSPGSWGFYRNLFEVSVETYFMKQGSALHLIIHVFLLLVIFCRCSFFIAHPIIMPINSEILFFNEFCIT